MDNEEEVITLLIGAGTTDDPYGRPVDMIAQTFRCDRGEAEGLVKELEAGGKIKRSVQTFRLQGPYEESEHLKYNWIRPMVFGLLRCLVILNH